MPPSSCNYSQQLNRERTLMRSLAVRLGVTLGVVAVAGIVAIKIFGLLFWPVVGIGAGVIAVALLRSKLRG